MTNSISKIIPCKLLPEVKEAINTYADALRKEASRIGSHGLSEIEFWDSGLFRSAIERLRGIQAASMVEKKDFMETVLDYMESAGSIRKWSFSGAGERHDYELLMPDGRVSIIETKGCLDGNNTNIFERPPNADEFIIWSLCQNPGSDPVKNAWSGIHTRLSAEIIHRKQKVDGLVIWDMVCGTRGRPCPKVSSNLERITTLGTRNVPPPCIYLFPRSIPDCRSNPNPPCWKLNEVRLLEALTQTFKGNNSDVVEVHIEARMEGVDIQRKTSCWRESIKFVESKWTNLKRASR